MSKVAPLVIDAKEIEMRNFMAYARQVFGPEDYNDDLAALLFLDEIQPQLPLQLMGDYKAKDVLNRQKAIERIGYEYIGRYFVKIKNSYTGRKP